MELNLLNKAFQRVDVVDDYESCIWTERFYKHGDCQLDFSLKDRTVDQIPEDFYLQLPDSKELMIVEQSKIVTKDMQEGPKLEVKGRTLSSIIERRNIWSQTNINSNLANAVKRLLDENILVPTNTNRRVSNMFWRASGPTIPSVAVEAQYQGENLYETIEKLITAEFVGLRVLFEDEKDFIVDIYGGVDRSYNQIVNPYVVFSPEFENLSGLSYFSDKSKYGNVILVIGEGEGAAKRRVAVNRPGVDLTGLSRYEKTINTSVSSNNGEIPTATYAAMLTQEGKNALVEFNKRAVIDGEADPTITKGYNVDYFLGDIVQISDGVGINQPARIVEYIRSQDREGYRAYPSFAMDD